ncbi:MAG TPA: hypothetical protein DEH15_19915 [Marinilabiliales bacterium]|nr:hypothetical protein [Marinilabiliales bacterium]
MNVNKCLHKGLIIILFVIGLSNCNMKSTDRVLKAEQQNETLEVLRNNMQTQEKWVKVHAAEFLLWSGYPDGVKETFLREDSLHEDVSFYRIGIWRVLAQADQKHRDIWIDKIKKAFLDEKGIDRIHAIETLAKLNISPFENDMKINELLVVDSIDNFIIYKLWSFAYTSEESFRLAQNALLKLTVSADNADSIRVISAYALKKLGELDYLSWKLLAESALTESSSLKVNLLNAAIITADIEALKTNSVNKILTELIDLNEKDDKNVIRMNLLDALAEKGTKKHLDLILSVYKKLKSSEEVESIDVLSSCAYALLMINNKQMN